MGMYWPTEWVLNKMASQQLTEKEFVDLFEAKSAKLSKLLLLIIIPLTGGLLKLLFYRKKKYAFDHFTLSAEINTFNLYLNFLLVPVIMKLVYWLSMGNLDLDYGDNIYISSVLALLMIGYVTVALQRFYAVKTLHALFKSLLFLAGHIIIAYFIYRLILFCIVMLLI